MLTEPPFLLVLVFLAIFVACLFLFYNAMKSIGEKTATSIMIGLICWSVVQSIFAYIGLYTDFNSLPPSFLMAGIMPMLAVIALVLIHPLSRKRIIKVNLELLTWVHVIRIPIEFGLLWLFLIKLIPQEMTFEGINFDILSGLSAPFVILYGIRKRRVNRIFLLCWNIVCLALLLSTISIAMLSTPYSFQKIAHAQPNIAIFYFPFVLIPTVVVPVILFSQLLAIVRLSCKRTKPRYDLRTYNASV